MGIFAVKQSSERKTHRLGPIVTGNPSMRHECLVASPRRETIRSISHGRIAKRLRLPLQIWRELEACPQFFFTHIGMRAKQERAKAASSTSKVTHSSSVYHTLYVHEPRVIHFP